MDDSTENREKSPSKLFGFLDSAQGLVAVPTGIFALFAAIASGRPASSITIAICIAAALLVGGRYLWVERQDDGKNRFPRLRFLLPILSLLLLIGMAISLIAPQSREFFAYDVFGFDDSRHKIAIEQIEGKIALSPQSSVHDLRPAVAYRAEVTVNNKGGEQRLVTSFSFSISRKRHVACGFDDRYIESFVLDQRIILAASNTKNNEYLGYVSSTKETPSNASKGAPSQFFAPAKIVIYRGICSGENLSIQFPMAVKLLPHEYTKITLDIPNPLKVTSHGQRDRFIEYGSTAGSGMRQRGCFRSVACGLSAALTVDGYSYDLNLNESPTASVS